MKNSFKISSFALAVAALSAFTACSDENSNNEKIVPQNVVPAANVAVKISENDEKIIATGTNFSAEFSKNSGALEKLIYGKNSLVSEENGLRLNAFRAVTNNDNWAYQKWFENGLFDLKHEVDGPIVVSENENGTATISFVVRSRGKFSGKLKGDPLIQYGNPINGIPLEIELGNELDENALTFSTQQIWTIYPDGSLELAANISSNLPNFDLPRLGFIVGVPAEFSKFSYYGRGPQENYNDRNSGAFVGIFESRVPEQVAKYAKPQETGNHEDVRWCALTNDFGEGAIFVATTGKFAAGALPVPAQDLIFSANPHILEKKIKASGTTFLTLDAGVRGLGGASCGPDTERRDKIFAASTDFGFVIRPVVPEQKFRELANISPAGTTPISVVRDKFGNVEISSRRENAKILVSVNGAPAKESTGTLAFKNGGTISAWFAETPKIRSEFSFEKIEKIPTSVVFASSENGGSEAATNLVDGDPATIWHTAYSVTQADFPHWVDFDVGEVKKIRGISYLPRQSGPNGDVKDFEIYVSLDGENWGEPVAKGAFENTKSEKKISFPREVEGRFVRFRALSSQNGQIFASGAEFGVLAD